MLDIGGGAGYFTAEFRARGADCYLFEPDPAELFGSGRRPEGAVLADGYWLPVRDGGADICFSSNVLEHVPDPIGLIGEMIRVTRPGGLIYLSFRTGTRRGAATRCRPGITWARGSPSGITAGGTGASPSTRSAARCTRCTSGPRSGSRSRPEVEIVDALPRYYPRWCRPLVRVPGLREVLTWNLLLVLRRKP